jgi:hypothetical protein
VTIRPAPSRPLPDQSSSTWSLFEYRLFS